MRGLLPDGWTAIAAAMSALTAIPTVIVLAYWLAPPEPHWQHIAEFLLLELVQNTAILLSAVLLGCLLLGGGLAWIVAVFEFPGRKWFNWALFLPFAFPTYVLGYINLDLFDLGGPVQSAMRAHAPGLLPWLPDIYSAAGLSYVMILAFYPYVYLFAREGFQTHGLAAMEAGRSLGYPPWRSFFKAVLPVCRPWLAGGLLLVAMETLADFGTVAIFNFDTFTTAIYKSWESFFSLATAAQLASLLVFLALAFLMLEKFAQRHKRFYADLLPPVRTRRMRLRGWRGWSLTGFCGLVLLLGAGLPAAHLVYWMAKTLAAELNRRYAAMVVETLLTGLLGALVICVLAWLLAAAVRFGRGRVLPALAAVATMGYALPGVVLAVGIIVIGVALDKVTGPWFGWRLWAGGSLVAMLAAYTVRFLAPAFKPIQSAYANIHPSLDQSARNLGCSRLALMGRVHWPLLRGGLFTAFLLVMIDVMKEMPITLMTKPTGWHTLAVRIFQLTSEGDFERAALPAFLLVLTGLVPVMILNRYAKGEHPAAGEDHA